MGLADFLRRLSRELKRAGVPFVLVGGFAVNAYGFSRATGDIDFLMVEDDFEKALPFLEAIGVKLLQRQHLYATLKHEAVLMKVDILFTDKKTMEEILKETKETTVKGEKFLIPSLEHLIALKLHAAKQNPGRREFQDLRDMTELIHQNKMDVSTVQFRELCTKYGSKEIYIKIKEAIEAWKD